jgi:UDPglucose--hexose-1-phosphate uridylyltransferase
MCDTWRHELDYGKRLVAENNRFAAFCPYASQLPFETYLVPKRHQSDFLQADRDTLESCAEMIGLILTGFSERLGNPPYNAYLHSVPFGSSGEYHWHFVVLPKMGVTAGFEFATGITINSTDPDDAARLLRGE